MIWADSWAVVHAELGEHHIVPRDDIEAHTLHPACLCRPCENEPGLHLHHAFDGRERHEQGAPLH